MKEQLMFGYNVNIERSCTHSEREDVEWGSWSESYDNYFNNITKTKLAENTMFEQMVSFRVGGTLFVNHRSP